MTAEYPEIKALQNIWDDNGIRIEISKDQILETPKDFRALEFYIKEEHFTIYADNEYGDIEVGNGLLNLCLVFRALEDYNETDDYLIWCRQLYLDASIPGLREYYMGLGKVYERIYSILGKIDSQVSNFDFELNAGAAQELRRM